MRDARLLHVGRPAVAGLPDTRKLRARHLDSRGASRGLLGPRSRMSELSAQWRLLRHGREVPLPGRHPLRMQRVQLQSPDAAGAPVLVVWGEAFGDDDLDLSSGANSVVTVPIARAERRRTL